MLQTLSTIYAFVMANGYTVAEALLSLIGAIGTITHLLHADGANAFFNKLTVPLQYVANKLKSK